MRSGKRLGWALCAMLGGAAFMFGQVEWWVEHVPGGRLLSALVRKVPMPGGMVSIRRPPDETRPAISTLIASEPSDAGLYRARAREAEMALDFAAAEADWKVYAERSPDRFEAELELADFYHRRIRPSDEVAALRVASEIKDDPLETATAQRGWRTFERMAAVIEGDGLPVAAAVPVYRAWTERYPKEPAAERRFIEYLVGHGQYETAKREIARYEAVFHDRSYVVKERAALELRRGSAAGAIQAYDAAFEAGWPDDMAASYFKLLEENGQLREFVGRARAALERNRADLDATARLFHYFRSQNNPAAARRVLIEYRAAKDSRKQAWAAGDLATLAQLFARVPDVNEAARAYYGLYSAPPANGAHVERALAAMAGLLLDSPAAPIAFGSGDLSFYMDIATVDASPGFWNGILSLVLNGTGPRRQYEQENQRSAAWFHRAAASELVALLEQRFPNSDYRDSVRAKLISAYAAYGDDDEAIRAGRDWLGAFPRSGYRLNVAMQMADALGRKNQTSEEFALYAQLLRELAAGASGVPIGSGARARSQGYTQVLDRYLSRLLANHRVMDALQVYRTELDRNPNDPGLYERLAVFLEQNGTARDVAEIYTRAIAKFPDRSWYHKLARWYLRIRESSEFEAISRRVVAVFSGTELEQYFASVVSQASPDAVLYRQLNLYAHERFPQDLMFVRNLIGAYSRKETYDAAAYDALLREYWFYDAGLRSRFFAGLARQGRLQTELDAIRKANPDVAAGRSARAVAVNPAAVQFATEAEGWLSHFEAAAPAARALATAYPGSREYTKRAAALYRSLAAYSPNNTEVAASLAESAYRAEPRDTAALAAIGDIFADREQYGRARQFWNRMPDAQPGRPDAYLEAATVFWDYYQYGDALRMIRAARRRFGNAALFRYQEGAIDENRRNFTGAVAAYMAGAIAGEMQSQSRLLRLASRTETRDLVDRATREASGTGSGWAGLSVRVAVLEALRRRAELEPLLRARAAVEGSAAVLNRIQEAAGRNGFDAVEESAMERLVAVTNDPIDKMRLTLALARLYESKKELDRASKTVDVLYRANPAVLGVVRGAVDFHLRHGQHAEAIAILLEAAKRARGDFAGQFTLEAARAATDAKQFAEARGILSGLLAADAYRPEYLAAMADTYLQAGDDRGFRDYQLATINRLKASGLPGAEQDERITAIRRSLIPALTRLGDFESATEQYIEVVNRYPEDEGLTREAAGYAVAHKRTEQLAAFYGKTIQSAPRDYRWPIVLGRMETVMEDFPAAISDYELALVDRPNRPDVLEAKARLEERLLRFREASASYGKLYELTYRDPQWLIKVAELEARLGRREEAVRSVESAIIGAHTETAEADFSIAGYLESWHLLNEAAEFAERGAQRTAVLDEAGSAAYTRIMMLARRTEAVLSRLTPETNQPGRIANLAGDVVARFYTPEEKADFEQRLRAKATGWDTQSRNSVLLPLATAAGLAELESSWRWESMVGVDPRLVQLETRRGKYAELGRQMEAYATSSRGVREVEPGALNAAAQAYAAEGDLDGEIRVVKRLLNVRVTSGPLLDRFFSVLAVRRPEELREIFRATPLAAVKNRAIQAAIANGRRELASSLVAERGSAMGPLWTNAYTALTGVYFDDRGSAVSSAFANILDTRTIGERLKTVRARDEALAGPVWFYYAERFGEYLAAGKNGDAETYLRASLEAAPGNANAYLALGDFYAQTGRPAEARDCYDAVLQLDADRGDAYDHAARVLWSEGRRTEAMAQWRSGLAVLLRVENRGVLVPGTFWEQVASTISDIGERHVLAELRGGIEKLLTDYIRINGDYRLNELVAPAARASLASGEGWNWLLALARATDSREQVISALMRLGDLTAAQRIALARERVAIAAERARAAYGPERVYAGGQEVRARAALVTMLLGAGELSAASAEWEAISQSAKDERGEGSGDITEVELRLAAKTGTLDRVLERYRATPERAPAEYLLRGAAERLRARGDAKSAQAVLEFVYDRELERGRLEAANFLGLAEVRLEQQNPAAALALLNRMVLVTEDSFETFEPAAELLEKYGRKSEAREFLERRVRAVPWDAHARIETARSGSGAQSEALLASAITDSQAEYGERARAARLYRGRPIAAVANTELAVLSLPAVEPVAASKPYFVEARVAAAATAADQSIRLRLFREALAIAPADARVRVGAVEAALWVQQDGLALALAQGLSFTQQQQPYVPQDFRAGIFPRRFNGGFSRAFVGPITPAPVLPAAERAALSESLAAAAERLDDLAAAQNYLRTAINLLPGGERAQREAKLKLLAAEQARRAQNASREPVIQDIAEQHQIVRPEIRRSAQ
ncbi:MAG: tetratricopeptide repeat protein [Acidobacteriia bacterium]|nr:tetratricopeptide repeat protein [Terriglobia bacterium]